MLITAQHVERPSDKRTGFNVVLYRHAPGLLPRNAGKIDVSLAVNSVPEDIVDYECDLVPGGNRVLSFLAIAADEGINQIKIVHVLREYQKELSQVRARPAIILDTDISVQFENFAHLTLDIQEFDELRTRLLRLMEVRGRNKLKPNPLTAIISDGPSEELSFQLDKLSLQRVAKAHRGGRFNNVRFMVKQDVLDDIIHYRGSEEILNSIVNVLTNLTPEEVMALGGIQFKNDNNNSVILTWPIAEPEA